MSVAIWESGSYRGAAGAGLLDAAGGVATVILAICGLAGIYPPTLTSAAVVVLGVELVARGGMIVSGFSAAARDPNVDIAMLGDDSEGLATLLMAGFGGIILGILAILGIAHNVLAAVAVIGFGVALVLSNGAGAFMRGAGSDGAVLGESVPTTAGLAALVLGVLALVRIDDAAASLSLILVALLILGAGALVSSGGVRLIGQRLTRPGA